jgi:hypothetical protein
LFWAATLHDGHALLPAAYQLEASMIITLHTHVLFLDFLVLSPTIPSECLQLLQPQQ